MTFQPRETEMQLTTNVPVFGGSRRRAICEVVGAERRIGWSLSPMIRNILCQYVYLVVKPDYSIKMTTILNDENPQRIDRRDHSQPANAVTWGQGAECRIPPLD